MHPEIPSPALNTNENTEGQASIPKARHLRKKKAKKTVAVGNSFGSSYVGLAKHVGTLTYQKKDAHLLKCTLLNTSLKCFAQSQLQILKNKILIACIYIKRRVSLVKSQVKTLAKKISSSPSSC